MNSNPVLALGLLLLQSAVASAQTAPAKVATEGSGLVTSEMDDDPKMMRARSERALVW